MTLIDLKPGQRSRIRGWASSSPPGRLLEMGMLPGAEVELIRFAPLGDPIDIKVRGFHLSIRKSEAQLVEIEAI